MKTAPKESAQVNPELREFLREWRRNTASEQNVPPFVVMHDTTLDDLCKRQPSSMGELLLVFGIGESKAKKYGAQILDAFKRFQAGDRTAPRPQAKLEPAGDTMRLLREGKSLAEIAQVRGRRVSTIVSMVSDLVERGFVEFQPEWVQSGRRAKIEAACATLGLAHLRPLKDALPQDFTYDEIRLVVCYLRWRRGNQSSSAAAS